MIYEHKNRTSGCLRVADASGTSAHRPGRRQFYTRSFKCLVCHERLEFDTVDGATWVHCSCKGWRPHTPAHKLPMGVINAERENPRGVYEGDKHG